jgi:hypothetical protein
VFLSRLQTADYFLRNNDSSMEIERYYILASLIDIFDKNELFRKFFTHENQSGVIMSIYETGKSLLNVTNGRHVDENRLGTTRSAYGRSSEVYRGAPNRSYGTLDCLAKENLSFHWEYHGNQDSVYQMSIDKVSDGN